MLNDPLMIKLARFFELFTAFCDLLITCTNSLDPDQDRQKLFVDLGPNCWTLMGFLRHKKRHANYPACRVK